MHKFSFASSEIKLTHRFKPNNDLRKNQIQTFTSIKKCEKEKQNILQAKTKKQRIKRQFCKVTVVNSSKLDKQD